MSETKEPKEQKLVPDFAVDETETADWGPLTQANPDYETLWSAAAWVPPEAPPDPPATEKVEVVDEVTAEHKVESEPKVKAPPEPRVESEPKVESSPKVKAPAKPKVPKKEPVETKPVDSSAPAADTPGFTGTLVTGDEVLTASMVVGPEIIVLWGSGHEIGSWTHEEAKIARLTFSRFAIQAEGDTLTFTADDPTTLDQAISSAIPQVDGAVSEPSPELSPNPPAASTPAAPPVVEGAKRPRIKGFLAAAETPAPEPVVPSVADISLPVEEEFNTIADNVRARSGASTVKPRRFSMTPQSLLIKVGVFLVIAAVVSGLVFLGLLVSGELDGGEPVVTTVGNPATTGIPVIITTAPVPTAATTLPPPMTTLFETDVEDLIKRWNDLSSTSDVPILLPPELSSPFFLLLAPNVTLEGVLDPAAGNVTLRATPTGTPEGDAPTITALGLLIATADPTLDGSDRRALLVQLGLDVNEPDLAGLDGSLTYNGLGYRLVYDQSQNSLAMIITPDPASSTTTN